MLQVIVPLDFSEPSFNAAHYACNMFKARPDVNIILYHFYANAHEATIAENYLLTLKTELNTIAPNIETFTESGENFADSLAAFGHIRRAYMIIMAVVDKDSMGQVFSESNTLKVTAKNVCPVLIIPAEATFSEIKNVLIASEMKFVQETPTLLEVKKILKDFNPAVHILNVDESHYIALTDALKTERNKMEELLKEFNPEFYFMRLYDFQEAVSLFTADKNIDIIIIAPRYHSFFDKLFKKQHTKKLIYQSQIPVLAIHE
jgi:hypothetical protein